MRFKILQTLRLIFRKFKVILPKGQSLDSLGTNQCFALIIEKAKQEGILTIKSPVEVDK